MAEESRDPADRVRALLEESARVKRALAAESADAIARGAAILAACFRDGGKALLFGNGGSAADSQHIAAEWCARAVCVKSPSPPATSSAANRVCNVIIVSCER